MIHYLLHSEITVMDKSICKPLGSDMMQDCIARRKVDLNILALK